MRNYLIQITKKSFNKKTYRNMVEKYYIIILKPDKKDSKFKNLVSISIIKIRFKEKQLNSTII